MYLNQDVLFRAEGILCKGKVCAIFDEEIEIKTEEGKTYIRKMWEIRKVEHV